MLELNGDLPEIILNEELHEYRVDGQVIVSVTTALKDLGFIDFSRVPPDKLEFAQVRGKAVHACCHYLEEGDLAWGSIHSTVLPYVEAYAEMKEKTGWIATLREQLVFHRALNYAGQLDGFGSMARLGIEAVLPDYKSGIPQKAARYQTAAYAMAIDKSYVPRCSIHLRGNGTYKIHWHKDIGDVGAWKNIIQTWHLKHRKD